MQAVGGTQSKPTYKEVEGLVDAASKEAIVVSSCKPGILPALLFVLCVQAVGGTANKPTYKEVEGLVDAARKAKMEIFKVAAEATSLDREAVSYNMIPKA